MSIVENGEEGGSRLAGDAQGSWSRVPGALAVAPVISSLRWPALPRPGRERGSPAWRLSLPLPGRWDQTRQRLVHGGPLLLVFWRPAVEIGVQRGPAGVTDTALWQLGAPRVCHKAPAP